MSKLKLAFGCWDYDRTRALMDGSVQADGIDLNYLNMPVEETFFRMLRNREFDIADVNRQHDVAGFTHQRRTVPRPWDN